MTRTELARLSAAGLAVTILVLGAAPMTAARAESGGYTAPPTGFQITWTRVISEGGKAIIFFHKVLPGTANKSYGIEVARLAGVPGAVLERARQILGRLERKQLNLTGRSRSSTVPEASLDDLQKGLFQ